MYDFDQIQLLSKQQVINFLLGKGSAQQSSFVFTVESRALSILIRLGDHYYVVYLAVVTGPPPHAIRFSITPQGQADDEWRMMMYQNAFIMLEPFFKSWGVEDMSVPKIRYPVELTVAGNEPGLSMVRMALSLLQRSTPDLMETAKAIRVRNKCLGYRRRAGFPD